MALVELKEQGNRAFSAGKPAAAAAVYTEAISLLPSNPIDIGDDIRSLASVLFSNRALCHRALCIWERCEEDARQALHIDRFNPKGHFLLGTVLLRRREYTAAITSLETGLEMARRQKRAPSVLREFEVTIAAGRQQWHQASVSDEREADIVLESFMEACVDLHRTVAIARSVSRDDYLTAIPEHEPAVGGTAVGVRQRRPASAGVLASGSSSSARDCSRRASVRYESATLVDSGLLAGASSPPPVAAAAKDGVPGGSPLLRPDGDGGGDVCGTVSAAARVAAIEAEHEERLGQLREWAAAREAARRERIVPPHLLCPITLEVILDPVVTPAGHSYERAALERCLRVKAEDPSTRAALHPHQLVPNLALRAAVAAFLQQHPWAHPLAAEAED